jgi:hypothetical protein
MNTNANFFELSMDEMNAVAGGGGFTLPTLHTDTTISVPHISENPLSSAQIAKLLSPIGSFNPPTISPVSLGG